MIIFLVLVILLSIFEIKQIIKDDGYKGIALYLVLATVAVFLGIVYISNPFGYTSISQYIYGLIGTNY